MTRRRASKDPQTIPLAPPSATATRSTHAKPLVEISEDEQWRLINQSGILKTSALKSEIAGQQEEELSLSDEIFNAVLLIIPFSAILLLMEVLIRHQYSKEASLEVITERMVSGVPILSLFIFYILHPALRYKQSRRMQALLAVLSITVGSRMLYLLDNASFLVNMKQCPPLATVWIYTIMQLDLELAVGSLICVGGFVWWKDLRILRG
ncbi:hypothetical protein BDN70DRAFT_875041 [Pholiota conissans]|uniref:DUF7719 domain-containing protein n=1 Tax=Pholiota conissans TaxID=109636 RepID=A0A9P5Z941_9AGAR|nr:hypothetical protein BDN70DRAFT_875041 [Pholiota conissans]